MPAAGEQWRGITNPFDDDAKPRLSEWTAKEIATLQSRLDKQLGPEFVMSRKGPGNRTLYYLPAEKAINLANEVFGFNGWSSSIKDVQIDFIDQNQSGRISLGVSITMRVTLKDGTYHEDIGYGHIENCVGKAAAFEKAKKEAATDALKRALRTFGNILGNCLYDKHYESKISKMKAPTPKWDPGDLHRHPDFATVKAERVPPQAVAVSPKPIGVATEQSVVSTGTEFEDEFGGNLFEGVDFDRPDANDDSAYESMLIETNNTKPNEQPNSIQQLQGEPRVQTLPHHRQTPGAPPPQNPQQPQQRPPINAKGPSSANGNAATRPDYPRQPSRPQQQQTSTAAPGQSMQKPQQDRSTPLNSSDNTGQNNVNAQHQQSGPQEATVGFVTGRAAELLQKATAGRPPADAPAFNPHAESPSLRRTSGIDHNKSAPVSRLSIAGVGNGASNGAAAVGPRPDIVNPQANATRRIGMPGMAQSPLANRSTYKPPGPVGVKRGPPDGVPRPPLADMSNVHVDGAVDGLDSKKAKLSGN